MTSSVKLKGMTWDHPRAYDSLLAASAEFQQTFGIKTEWHKRSLQDFADVPIADLANEFDLVVLDHPHVGQIGESGCLTPLRDMSADASIGGSVESYQWIGQTWALPIDAACQMSVIRPDLSNSFPRHWEEILATSENSFRLITPLKPVDAFDMMLTLVASSEADAIPFSPDQFCSEQSGLFALQILKHLFKLGPIEAAGWNPIDVLEILSETNDFAASPCLFGYINYARAGFRANTLHYVDLPTFKDVNKRRSILGGAGIGVSALKNNTSAAIQFAEWVTSEPIQSGVYLQNEGQPAHFETWQKWRSNSQFSGFFDGGFDTIDNAWTRPRDFWFLNFVDDICEVFPEFFLKDQDEALFLNHLNTIYRSHIKEASK